MNKAKRLTLGIFVLLLVDVIWVASSELTYYIFNEIGYDKPFFSSYLKVSLFTFYLFGFLFWKPWRHQCLYHSQNFYQVVDVVSNGTDNQSDDTNSLGEPSYIPLKVSEFEKSSDGDSDDASNKSVRFSKLTEVRQMSNAEAMEAMLSRLSFQASVRAEQIAQMAANRLQIREVMKISFVFSLLFFLSNYTYQLALSNTEAGIVNVISSTSGLFTLILASAFPSSVEDRFSLGKLFACILMVPGVAIISVEDMSFEETSIPVGVIWAIISSLLYAFYIVFLKRKVPSEDKMDFSMFFGFVGLFNMLLLWPAFPILNALGWETFQLPDRNQFLFMLINGIVGTVLSELLWVWGCFLTSSLMATLSLSLTIPLTMVVDTIFKGGSYPWLLYVGIIPMLISFVMASVLTHVDERCEWNLSAIKRFLCCKQEHSYSPVNADSTEQESLIVDDVNLDNGGEDLFEDHYGSYDEENATA